MSKRKRRKVETERGNRSGEDLLLKRIRRGLSAPASRRGAEGDQGGLLLGIGDDAAVWRPRAGYETVLTCDWFLEGTHFLLNRHPPHAVGWKCLARAVSDVAAMGAEPRCFLLSLALPTERSGSWLAEFLRGLRAASRKLKCRAAGGDTTRREEVLVNIMVVGECRRGRAVLRSGARAGDAIFVSGRLGEAEYGLRLMKESIGRLGLKDARLRKHLYPEPRVAIGGWLAERRLATAMMDLSDGLSNDLPRLCAASGVGARIEETRLPLVRLAEPLKRAPGTAEDEKFDAASLGLHGGDDYELLFTVAPGNVGKIPRRIGGVSVACVGEITAARRIVLLSGDGRTGALPTRGWDPFRGTT